MTARPGSWKSKRPTGRLVACIETSLRDSDVFADELCC